MYRRGPIGDLCSGISACRGDFSSSNRSRGTLGLPPAVDHQRLHHGQQGRADLHTAFRTRLSLPLGPATDGCRIDESTRSQPLQIGGEGTDRVWANDGEGTEGLVELVYQDSTNRVYYVEGTHTSTVLPDITGTAVVFVKMNPVQDGQGNEMVETTLVAYARLNSRVLAGLVSLIRPLVGNTIARKLTKGVRCRRSVGAGNAATSRSGSLRATDPPPLPHDEVAFLKQALEHLLHSSSAPQFRMPLP